MLTPGTAAPDFELDSTIDNSFRLSAMKGKRVVLAFYPADWSPVCTDQLSFYNEALDYFTNLNAVLVAISVDSKWCHLAFSRDRKLEFPLLADFEPKGRVAEKYGAYDTKAGECRRALYVLDENGIVAWSYLSPIDQNPGMNGILTALEDLNKSDKKK